jgi:ubiquitin-protein ligase
MLQARLRRLRADHERVTATFTAHPFIRLVAAEGDPPEKYVFEIHVAGLVPGMGEDESLRPARLHRAEVFLPLDYPRRPPFCRMLTPVFHPNIDPQKICIGDHWSAGESLAHMIARIAEMICYQSYNVKSPLNARAAAWVEQNVARLPLHRGDLTVGL